MASTLPPLAWLWACLGCCCQDMMLSLKGISSVRGWSSCNSATGEDMAHDWPRGVLRTQHLGSICLCTQLAPVIPPLPPLVKSTGSCRGFGWASPLPIASASSSPVVTYRGVSTSLHATVALVQDTEFHLTEATEDTSAHPDLSLLLLPAHL